MSKNKVHYAIRHAAHIACGIKQIPYKWAFNKRRVTCESCRKTKIFLNSKVHYAKYPRVPYSVCGIHRYSTPYYLLRLTRTKKEVTCKNCKRTKKFKSK